MKSVLCLKKGFLAMKSILLVICLDIFANVLSVPVASLTWLAAKSATSRFQQLPEVCKYIADEEKSDDIAAHLTGAAVMTNEHLTCEDKHALIKHIYLNRHHMWKANESIFRFLAYMLKNDIIPVNQKVGREIYKLTSCNAIVPNPIAQISHIKDMPLLHYIIMSKLALNVFEWFLIGKGLNIQIRNIISGENALHEAIKWASWYHNTYIVEKLLFEGIDTKVRNVIHETPLEFAKRLHNSTKYSSKHLSRLSSIVTILIKHDE